MIRRMLDPYIFSSLSLIAVTLFMVGYPLASFYFGVYLGMPKGLVYDARVTYTFVFEVGPGNGLEDLLKTYGTDEYAVVIELANIDVESGSASVAYKLLAVKGGVSLKSVEDGGVVLGEYTVIDTVERVESLDKPLLALLLPPREGGAVGLELERRGLGFYLAIPDLRPDRLLGVPRTYGATYISMNSGELAGGVEASCTPPDCSLLYIGLDDSRLLLLQFSTEGPGGERLARLLAYELLGVFEDSIVYSVAVEVGSLDYSEGVILGLTSISGFVPGDQAWLEYLWWNFNRLFPFSYAMVMASIIILIVRVRRWF